MNGFIKLNRNCGLEELIEARPTAYILLSLIAYRAKRTSRFSSLNLKTNQALLGDWRLYASSEQVYRDDKTFLERHKLATFTGTSKGTIATLLNKEVFDINREEMNEQVNEQKTTEERTKNEQKTTNKECKNERMEKNEKKSNSNELEEQALKSETKEQEYIPVST